METFAHPSCPCCSNFGGSVAAINYKETYLYRKEGNFSGTGVGLGTGGLSVGLGGGVYSENSAGATKRAQLFSEPETEKTSPMPLCFSLMLKLIVAMFVISISCHLADIELSPLLLPITGAISMLLIIICHLYGVDGVAVDNREGPSQAHARYKESRYCEQCHVLFDGKGSYRDADSRGFEELMAFYPSSADK